MFENLIKKAKVSVNFYTTKADKFAKSDTGKKVIKGLGTIGKNAQGTHLTNATFTPTNTAFSKRKNRFTERF